MDSSDDHAARLRAIGWRAPATPLTLEAGQRIARVIAQHRNGYRLHDGDAEVPAQPAPRFLRRSTPHEERPAVGDFVVASGTHPAIIEKVLERRSLLSRAAAGERHQ